MLRSLQSKKDFKKHCSAASTDLLKTTTQAEIQTTIWHQTQKSILVVCLNEIQNIFFNLYSSISLIVANSFHYLRLFLDRALFDKDLAINWPRNQGSWLEHSRGALAFYLLLSHRLHLPAKSHVERKIFKSLF